MNTLLNIIVLVFEVLYYSLFMKYSKNKGNFCKYALSFVLITLTMLFIGNNNFLIYLIFVLLSLNSLKFIVKTKTTLYDMLVIMIMLFVKILIETPLYAMFICLMNKYIVGLIVGIIKIAIVYVLKDKLGKFYLSLKKKWDNNNFYIRYIFSILTFIYCIAVVLFFIILPSR